MGIMEPQDIRWVGAFHTNSEKNFHVHVISWDDSGRFDSLIPKVELENARQELVARATAPARQKINNARMQAREGLAADIGNNELTEVQRRKMRQIIDRLPERGEPQVRQLGEKRSRAQSRNRRAGRKLHQGIREARRKGGDLQESD